MSQNKHLYSFEKKKTNCPNCGQKTFSHFATLPPQFGICDRVNSCGYKLTPTRDNLKLFSINPEKFTIIQDNSELTEPEYILPDARIAAQAKSIFDSALHQFFYKIKVAKEHLKKWRLYGDKLYTFFLYYNEEDKFANLHKIAYRSENGKRIKPADPEAKDYKALSFSLRQPADGKKKYKKPLYGLWQLQEERLKHRPVAIVESQKTAILASFHYPELLWLSADSANGLTAEKIAPLVGREIWWLCDADTAGRHNSSLRNLAKSGLSYKIIDLTPDLNDGSDIADLLIQAKKPIFYSAKINADTGEISYEAVPDYLYKDPKKEEKKEEIEPQDYDKTHAQLGLPDDVDIDEYLKKGYFERNNNTYMRVKTKDSDYPKRVSNFVMKPLFFVESEDSFRVIELINNVNERAIIIARNSDLTSNANFANLCESHRNFLWEGDMKNLNVLKRDLFFNLKRAKHISVLGWQAEKFWAWANGIFTGENFIQYDEYGIAKRGNMYYFSEIFSKLSQYSNEDDKKFIFKQSQVDFAEWAKMFARTYAENDNGAIGILFYCATIFADEVISKLKLFPILNLFGRPGSGKSTMARSLTMLFGDWQSPIGLGNSSTGKNYVRKLAQRRNAFVWYDEFKNSIGAQKIDILKNIFDRIGYGTAQKTQDFRTTGVPVNAVAIISGQEAPTQDVALLTRCISLVFNKDEFSEKEKEEYDALKNIEDIGISSITNEVLKNRASFESKFYEHYKAFQKKLTAEVENISDRVIASYATLLATYKVLTNTLVFPFSEEYIYNVIIRKVREQQNSTNNATDLQKFWDSVQHLFEKGEIRQDEDFQIFANTLYLRITKVHPLYLEHFKRVYGTTGLDKTTLIHYICSNGAEHKDAKRFKYTNTSCYVFNDYFGMQKKYGISLVKDSDYAYEQEKVSLQKEYEDKDKQENPAPPTDDVPF